MTDHASNPNDGPAEQTREGDVKNMENRVEEAADPNAGPTERDVQQVDRTALSYWFPLIEAAGIPVPKTKLVRVSREAQRSMFNWFDGQPGTGEEKPFFDELSEALASLGYPAFLRTDHTSDKHNWDKACFLADADDLKQHVYNIVEFSECCGMIGLPWDVWVAREFLPTIPHGTCPHYGNMPVCREFRFFVDDGAVRCAHPYWPRHALNDGGWAGTDSDFEMLCHWPHELRELAEAAGKAVGGSWSIDILETKRGWYVTDMAEAHKSFHWEGCELAERPVPRGQSSSPDSTT